MLNITDMLINEVEGRLASNYAVMFGPEDSGHLDFAIKVSRQAISLIATSNALYHNQEHTAHVAIVGMQILLGRHIERADVTREDWLNVMIALVCHDVGYVRGACGIDDGQRIATGIGGQWTTFPPGISDAALMPLHIDRGKVFVTETLMMASPMLNVPMVQACIERTRFPAPSNEEYAQTGDFPGLVRGADLIGQLSDPRYLAKLSAVFFEFEETGFNSQTGYRTPGDLLAAYPSFFQQHVVPYISDAERYLGLSREGRATLAGLYGNLEAARQANTRLSAPRSA
jgi:hypothetical protein